MDELGQRLLRLPADTRTCLAFFTRLPVRSPEALDLRGAAAAFPIVGVVVGALAAGALAICMALGLPPLVSAAFAVATLVAIGGGLHEDGLADTADGLGGRTAEARLAIMRDSRSGTFGVLALALTLLIRVASIAQLALYPASAALALVTVAALSRALAMWHWCSLPSARPDGLAQRAGNPDRLALTLATGLGAVALVAAAIVFGWPAWLGVVVAAAGVWLLSRICGAAIGGHTGDTIGAAQQIAETLLLARLSSGLWHR